MDIKEKQEREKLYKTIWKIANELRGSVDGWDFKQYVLGLLFYRFISENIEKYINDEQRELDENFRYADLEDEKAMGIKDAMVKEKGFFILPSELFCNVQKKAKENGNLNTTLRNILDNIEASSIGAESNEDFKGLFNDFAIDSKLGNTVDEKNEKLVKLLDAINDLDFESYETSSIDLLGDAYEFLLAMYASNAGKSGGEFFTPQEVGELLARIIIMDKTSVNKVYDPACGSGGLLLKFAKILGKENIKNGFFGQEINLTSYNLARINMFLHGISYNKFSIKNGNTLTKPLQDDKQPFDAIVSNPPYSTKWEGKNNPLLISDERFAPAGVLAPSSKADLAFVMHINAWLSPEGTAAIVEFPGVLYRSGAEQKIRKYLVDNNFIDTIIQLPPNLFFGVTIATCILVLKKNKADTSVLFIDASSEFVKKTNKNKLSDNNIKNIVKLVKERKTLKNKTYLATYEDVKDNAYNLSVSTYVEKEDTREKIDIKVLNGEIQKIVKKENTLRIEIDKIIREIENEQN